MPRSQISSSQIPRSQILVVGDVFNDIIVHPSGPLESGTDTAATIRAAPGGSAANQAAWLGSFGNAVLFAGRVGAADRQRHEADLRTWGVEPKLACDPYASTGNIVSIISPDGQRSFFTDRGANSNLSAQDLPRSLLEGIALLHVSGYCLFEPGPRSAVLNLLAEAAALRIPISVDPGSVSGLRGVGAENFLHWTAGASFCFPNAEEAAVLTGDLDAEAQMRSLTDRYAVVVLKRGAHGAVAGMGSERWSCPAPATQALDTTGAGDAFLAAFLTYHLRGANMQSCLQQAVCAGTESTRIVGGRPLKNFAPTADEGSATKV